MQRFLSLRPDHRVGWVTGLLSTLLFVPYLGAVGLWDPWETHYGEVAREMIQRNDYVYPYWETAWFFSKPPLTMWMQALGMQLAGTERTGGMIPLYTEWGMRLPFAAFSILAIVLLSMAVTRLTGTRVGLATGLVLSTTPLYFLLTRQTVTDTPFVTSLICAMACALVAQLDVDTRHRDGWWYAFYVFCGLGVLAKGLLGLLPAVVLVLYAATCVMPWDAPSLTAHARWLTDRSFRMEVKEGKEPMPFLWGQLYRMHLLTGTAVFFVVALPWYATLFFFNGVDDEGSKWFDRFIIHDHFNRLAAGVHTTTPGGNFSYFIEQAGYAFFPWVALIPGAFLVAALVRVRDPSPREQLTAMTVLWTVLSFFVVAISATKFHHYLFPAVPGMAVLMALYVDKVWEEGIVAHAGSLLGGFVLLVLVAKDLCEPPTANGQGALYGGFKVFTDLFVYNYDRPYPAELLTRPVRLFSHRPLMTGEVLAVLLLALGGYFLMEGFLSQPRRPVSRASGAGLLAAGAALLFAGSDRTGVLGSLTSALGVVILWVEGELVLGMTVLRRSSRRASRGAAAVAGILALLAQQFVLVPMALSSSHSMTENGLLAFVRQPLELRIVLAALFTLFIGLVALGALLRSRSFVFGSFTTGVLLFALWFNWSHWVSLSHHWTQRDLFWRYFEKRRPGEPIAAYLMNWKGETFYSRNTVRQIPVADTNRKIQLFTAPPGREWVLVEHNRLNSLRSAVGPTKTVTPVDRDLNNKFVLVVVE